MIILIITIILVVILVDAVLIALWKRQSSSENIPHKLPQVSVLVAARNEEDNIERCLKSLMALDYPNNNLQILVGDDQSEDQTFQKALNVLKGYENFEVMKVQTTISNQKGKANVLAQLAKKASGQYLFITDADMELPESWIKGMLSAFDTNTGIVTGVTKILNNSNQSIDWLFALGMVKVLADYDIPVTSMGNNMAIKRDAYEAVGGYESIPFSITEDLELFKQVYKKGFEVKQLYNKEVLGVSKPMKGINKLLEQRKRWMQGAIQLPWPMVLLLFIQASYFPAQVLLLIILPQIALILILIKFMIQAFFIKSCLKQLDLRYSWFNLIQHEIHSWIVSILATIYFFIPMKVSWKGRKY